MKHLAIKDLCVAVIDGEADRRELLAHLVHRSGVRRLIQYDHPDAALASMVHSPQAVHIAVTNVSIPGVDAVKALHELSRLDRTPALIITASLGQRVSTAAARYARGLRMRVLGELPDQPESGMLAALIRGYLPKAPSRPAPPPMLIQDPLTLLHSVQLH